MIIKKKGLIDIFLLALLWGPSYLFIKVAVNEVTPLTLVTIRIGIGALLLYGFLKLKKISLGNDLNLLKHSFMLGILSNALPFICFSYSLQTIPSSLSALINGATPICTMFLAGLLLSDERLNVNHILGILLGGIGFLILFLPAVLDIHQPFDHMGVFFSLLGALSYAIANVYARKYLKEAPPCVAPTLQLATSLIYLIPLSFLLESPLEKLPQISLSAWGAMLSLGILGTALAFIVYHRLIRKQGAIAVGMVAYLLPIIGTLLGVVFLKEHIGVLFGMAAALIIAGVMAVNGVFRFKKKSNFNLEAQEV